MVRKISAPLYMVAFFITLAIFGVGVYLGSLLATSHVESLTNQVYALTNRLQTTQLIFLMENDTKVFCPVFNEELGKVDEEIIKIGDRLTYLEEVQNVYDDSLKSNYFTLELQSYLISKKLNEKCKKNSLLVLYFYSNKNCLSCRKQGEELTRARDKLTNKTAIKVYSFDVDISSSVANALKEKYNVSVYPSIVISDIKYENYKSSDELISLFNTTKAFRD